MATDKWLKQNREHILQYNREYNRKHPNRQKAYNKKVKDWFVQYKANLSCSVCGEDDPVCLDFHHRNPDEKENTLNKILKDHWSIERMKTEIAKCDVVCANCHRKIHVKSLKREKYFCDGEGI